MKTRLSMILGYCLGLSTLFTGCTGEKCPQQQQNIGDGVIPFSSNITRSPLLVSDNNKWDAGDLISIYMLKSGVALDANATAEDILYDGVQYKAKEDGLKVAFEPATEGDALYFPASGKVDFVSYYPSSVAVTPQKAIKCNVATDPQDILYSNNLKGKDQNAEAADMLLTFSHALSQVRVTLNDISGNTITTATLVVKGMKPEAILSLADGSLSEVQGSADISLPIRDNAHEGIIIPQSVGADQAKMVITSEGKNYEYVLPAITFEAGKRISYRLTLNEASGQVEAVIEGQIQDWVDVDGGSATLDPVTPSSEVSTFTISESSIAFDAVGGSKTLRVNTDATSFTAISSESWLTVTPDVAGGTLAVTASANTQTDNRTATITLRHSGILRSAPEELSVKVTQKGTTPTPEGWDGGISAIREAFEAGTTSIATPTTITGIIINNIRVNNNSSKNVIISDGKAGITIRLTENVKKEDGFDPGVEVEIAIPAGIQIQRYNEGSLQLNNLPKSAMKKVANTHELAPIEVSLADLMSDRISGDLESRLVKVMNVQFAKPGGAFAGSKNSYLTIQENSSSTAPEGMDLPQVYSASSQYNKLGIETIPEGNGSIVGATNSNSYKGKKNCVIYIRSAEDLQLNSPRQ